MNIVIDTNVLISAALSPMGNPAKIIRLVADDENICCYYSADILTEYREVMSRKHFDIDEVTKNNIMSAIMATGRQIVPIVSTIPMPDESDRTFYDTAKAAEAILITGNSKHYPPDESVMTPIQFMTSLSGV